jgi:hypothetical protein
MLPVTSRTASWEAGTHRCRSGRVERAATPTFGVASMCASAASTDADVGDVTRCARIAEYGARVVLAAASGREADTSFGAPVVTKALWISALRKDIRRLWSVADCDRDRCDRAVATRCCSVLDSFRSSTSTGESHSQESHFDAPETSPATRSEGGCGSATQRAGQSAAMAQHDVAHRHAVVMAVACHTGWRYVAADITGATRQNPTWTEPIDTSRARGIAYSTVLADAEP